MTLLEAISEYTDAYKEFNNCPDMIKSCEIPPESKKICDRYFSARDELDKICQESDNPIAQRYAETAALAYECPNLLLEDSVRYREECRQRMVNHGKSRDELLKLRD